jgi:hypothetical protein
MVSFIFASASFSSLFSCPRSICHWYPFLGFLQFLAMWPSLSQWKHLNVFQTSHASLSIISLICPPLLHSFAKCPVFPHL